MRKPIRLRLLMGMTAAICLPLSLANAQDPFPVGEWELIDYFDFESDSDGVVAGIEGNTGVLGVDAVLSDGGQFGNSLDTSALGGSFFVINGSEEFDGDGETGFVDEINAEAASRDQVSVAFWQRNTDELRNQVAWWMVSPSSGGSERGAQGHTPWSNDQVYFDTAGCCDAATQRINGPSGVEDWMAWNHFAFVKDGADKKVWINGEIAVEGESTDPLPDDIDRMYFGNGVELSRDQPGLMDELIVVAGAFSEEQIKALADPGNTALVLLDNSNPGINLNEGQTKSAGTLPAVSSDQEVRIKIKNSVKTDDERGPKVLTISSVEITGGDTDHFSLVSAPTSIDPEASEDLVLSFNRNGKFGTFSVTMNVKSDDEDADDQDINITVRAVVVNPRAPAGHYRLDETSTDDPAADSTRFNRAGGYSANGGTIALAQTGLAEGTGTAAKFTGGSNVEVTGLPEGSLSSFTISLWFNPASLGDLGGQDFRTIAARGFDSPIFGLLEGSGELVWFGEADGVADALLNTEGLGLAAGTTYHVAMRYNAETETGSFFVDGVEVASGPVPPFTDEGSLFFGSFGGGALPYDGTIDDVQAYDRAISEDDIKYLIANPGQVLIPVEADSDNDGLTDEREIALGTDFQNPDSDGDGLLDGEEVDVHNTNPLSEDSDGDTFSDPFEIAQESDPNDISSVPNDIFGEPSQSWMVLEALPTFNGILGGSDTQDATFRVFIDLEATDATEDERELIWESGGGTIGFSLVYETGNKLVLRAAGNGGNVVATVEYEVTADQLAAGELSIVWTFDVDNGDADAGQTIALYVNEVLVGQASDALSADWTGGDGAAFGVASASFAAGGENTALGNGVDFRSGTINLVAGLQFFADRLFVPIVPDFTIETLGVGAEFLLGGDLTDPEDDGLDAEGGATDPSWNWVAITSSHEPDFEGGENAFNIFDGKVGGGNDKWCCDDPTPEAPVWVSVEFADAVSLTHFTITNGNDTPGRDPTNWAIQGSNDGENFENIFAETEVSIWTETRNEVALVTLGSPSAPYTHLRYIAYDTPANLHQLNEIEYFGTIGGGSDPRADLGVVASSSGPVTEPTLVDFGELSGDATYEFIFNAIKGGASTAIAGNGAWGLKLEQWQDTGFLGTTEFGVVDNTSEAPTVFEADVHVVFVSDTAAGETRIYIDGALAGSTPGNPAISGEGAVMGARDGTTDPMAEGSVMYGWATYNTALSDADIATLAAAQPPGGGPVDPAPVPVFGSVNFTGDGLSMELPAGSTFDIEFSADLVDWSVIASDVTGSYSDADAARIGGAEGYYRGVVK